jgi:hypothetical protein
MLTGVKFISKTYDTIFLVQMLVIAICFRDPELEFLVGRTGVFADVSGLAAIEAPAQIGAHAV